MARDRRDFGEMRPGGHRMATGHHMDSKAGYEGLEADAGRRFDAERGGMSPRDEPIGFRRGPGRAGDAGRDRGMRGARVEMDGHSDVRGHPRRFRQGRPLFAETHGYDRGYEQPPLGRGRERGFGRDW